MFAAFLLALSSATESPKLADLPRDAAELKSAFNQSEGLIRLILILSPG